jgi:hypothetical protein
VAVWVLADLASGEMRAIDGLAGLQPASPLGGLRWLVFADQVDIGKAVRYATLDLRTGAVRAVAGMSVGVTFMVGPDVAPDGRHALIPTLKDRKEQLWLVDTTSGAARLVEEGDVVRGAFSPDSQWAAVSRFADGQLRLDLVATATGEETPLGAGYGPVWVAP